MEDKFGQELHIGDVLVVATTSNSYKFTVYLAVVYKLTPSGISVYTKQKGRNYHFNNQEEVCFLSTSNLKYHKRIIKIPKSKENIDLFLKDLIIDERQQSKLLELLKI